MALVAVLDKNRADLGLEKLGLLGGQRLLGRGQRTDRQCRGSQGEKQSPIARAIQVQAPSGGSGVVRILVYLDDWLTGYGASNAPTIPCTEFSHWW